MKYLTTLLFLFLCQLSAIGQTADDVVASSAKGIAAAPAKASSTNTALLAYDVNGDGVVNAVDIVDIVKYTRGSARTKFAISKADVNGDGKVNLDDARKLSDMLTGGEIPTSTPEPAELDPEPDPEPTTPVVITGDSVVDPSFN